MPIPTSSRIHVTDDALFDQHRARGYHPERPERLGAARRAVERCASEGLTQVSVPARDATDEEILHAHGGAYLEELMSLSGLSAALDADTYLGPSSVAAARRAAGASIAMVEALLEGGEGSRGLSLLRPPGHHATRDRGMGFCLLNNIAIATHWALSQGVTRVSIVDFDVHHGNGTQDIFWSDPRVQFVSLHEYPMYPGTGGVNEIGGGEGEGFTVNVPLSRWATDAVYRLAFEEVVLPVLRRHRPELLLVSAGFDAHERDPLASMQVTDAGFGFMARALAEAADELGGGRIGLLLEGGYDLRGLEGSLVAAIQGLFGVDAGAGRAGDAVGDQHRREVEQARQAAKIGAR